MARVRGEFKTAYLQRELPLDIVTAESDLKVGDVVTLTECTFKDADGDSHKGYKVVKYTTNPPVPSTSHYIVAQSDMTLKSGAVPVNSNDIYNYYYKDTVAANITTTGASSSDYDVYDGTTYYKYVSGVSSAKTGALYRVVDTADVIYTYVA